MDMIMSYIPISNSTPLKGSCFATPTSYCQRRASFSMGIVPALVAEVWQDSAIYSVTICYMDLETGGWMQMLFAYQVRSRHPTFLWVGNMMNWLETRSSNFRSDTTSSES